MYFRLSVPREFGHIDLADNVPRTATSNQARRGETHQVSAAEYTTFVLRALGYSSETDFLWSSPWALSNAIGLTDGSYSSANNNAFVRGDMAIISADALDVTVNGGKETLAKKIGVFSATVDSYLNRVLSDKKLAALKNADLDTLRAEISTIGDAVAFLDQFTPTVYAGFGDEIRLDIEFLFDLHTRPEATFHLPMLLLPLGALLLPQGRD